MENKRHPINDVIDVTMQKVREMVDVDTVVGTPIHTPEGVTVIPISKISFGFGSGGSDFTGKHQPAGKENSFGGGAAAGVNIDPVAFLIIRADSVRLLPVGPVPGGPVEKAIDIMPDLVDRVSGFMDKRKAEKEASAAEKEASTAEKAADAGQGE